jgi:uncharacterized OB-fold protein
MKRHRCVDCGRRVPLPGICAHCRAEAAYDQLELFGKAS